jgi:hypothetical protein
VAGDVILIVTGVLASLWCGLFDDVPLPGRLARLSLRSGTVTFDVIITLAMVLPAWGALDLAHGRPAWLRVTALLLGLLGSGVAIGSPTWLRRIRAEQLAPVADVPTRRPVRKWRT